MNVPTVGLLVGLLCAGAGGAAAQSPGSAGPSFLIVRYASRSSQAMYSGYTTGPVFLVAGMLQNPRTESPGPASTR